MNNLHGTTPDYITTRLNESYTHSKKLWGKDASGTKDKSALRRYQNCGIQDH